MILSDLPKLTGTKTDCDSVGKGRQTVPHNLHIQHGDLIKHASFYVTTSLWPAYPPVPTLQALPMITSKVKVAQSCPTLFDPMDCSPWNSPGQNIGVGSLSLLQGIFSLEYIHMCNQPNFWRKDVYSLF